MDTNNPMALCCLICGEYSSDGLSILAEQERGTDLNLLDNLIAHIVALYEPELVLHSDNVCKLCWEIYKSAHELEKMVHEQEQVLLFRFINNKHKSKPKRVLTIPTDEEVEEEKSKKIHTAESQVDETKYATFDEITPELNKMHGESQVRLVTKRRRTEKKPEYSADQIIARNDSLYTCLLCIGENTVCEEADGIMAHMKTEHGIRVYVCDVCGDFCCKRNELRAHINFHIENAVGDFQCEVCNRIFSDLRLFRIHKRTHYPQAKCWTCNPCGKKFPSRNLLMEHMNRHTGARPYQCTVCDKKFASKYVYKGHLKTHEARARPHACSMCPKTFLSASNLMRHESTHTLLKGPTPKKFKTAQNLKPVRAGRKPNVCSICGKSFARPNVLRDHERTHTGERPHQCEICGATFSQRANLLTHIRATHNDDKRHACDMCGKAFQRRRLLDYHINAAHTGERPLKCTVCEATFVYPEQLKKHLRIHTGEQPYACEVCQETFNHRDNRNAHRFVHSDKQPYECMDCGAGFMRKPLLYKHMESKKHINDTFIINQPRLPKNNSGQMQKVSGLLEIEQRWVSRLHSDFEDKNRKLVEKENMIDDVDVYLTECIMLEHEAKSAAASPQYSDAIIVEDANGEVDAAFEC